MEKLTIEHLAPYLPYGLKIKRNNSILTVTGIVNDLYVFSEETYGSISSDINKPILRPLSDCINPMYSYGGFIIPFNYIFEYCNEYVSRHPNQKILSNNANGLQVIKFTNPLSLAYSSFKILLEYHFDVFGLIEKGLAIDMNTIDI